MTEILPCCPTCGSPSIEIDDPEPGESTCRNCGEWIEDFVPYPEWTERDPVTGVVPE